MVAIVLADEALRKFGGDSLAEFLRNHDGFLAALDETPSAVGMQAVPDEEPATEPDEEPPEEEAS
jgi:chorismate synthase